MQVEFEKRFTKGWVYQGNYTWSKSIDNISVDGSGFTRPIDSFNLALNRGRSGGDRPHNLNWNVSYTLPIGREQALGRGMPDWLDRFVGGWDLGSVGIWTSGPVMAVNSGRQTAGVDINTWANYSGDRNIGRVNREGNGVTYWTPAEVALFSFPGAGEIGTSGRNSFRGPRTLSVDLALAKGFRITEKHRVNLRVDAYNLLNRANFNPPGVSLLTPASFGRISSTAGARVLQAALRYDF
jgi:hypothetical protein